MPAPRILRLTVTGIAVSVAVAAAVGLYVAQWSNAPMRYFMPGPLGPARSVQNAQRNTRNNDDGGARFSRAEPFRAGGRAFLTRVIGLRTAEEAEWGKRNGLTEGIPFSHNLEHVFPRTLFATHPEFFPLTDGKRLEPAPTYHYWNPDLGREDVARFAAEQAREFFARQPSAISFSLGVNDGLVYGDSPETMRLLTPHQWFRGRPDFSRLVFTFMNRAAAELARTHPDKYLGCLAYYWCENVPPFPVDAHVIPFVTADRAQSYDPAFRREEFDLQRRWAAALGAGAAKHSPPAPSGGVRIGMYDYLDGYGFLVPRVPIHAFAEHIRHAHRVGFTDYYGESSRNWGLDGPLPWVITQLLQDPEQDVDRLLDEYYASYFQTAAGPMRRFFARCEEQWMRQPRPSYWLKYYRNEAQAELFPTAVCAELHALLDEAARLADGRAAVAARVAFVRDAFGVTERFVAFQEARIALATFALKQPLSGDAGRRRVGDYRDKRAEFIRYTHRLTERAPLAFYPIEYEDWLQNDPAFAAEAVLAATGATAANDSGREILPNRAFDGPLVPGRRISGLAFGIDLPAPWQGKVEPTENSVAVLVDKTGEAGAAPTDGRSDVRRFLHVRGAENTRAFQWLRVQEGRRYVASVSTRGEIASSTVVDLTMSWLNEAQQFVGGVSSMRMPAGSWPEWVRLQQQAEPPRGAVWLGVAVRVHHQGPNDWTDFADFSVREWLPARQLRPSAPAERRTD